MPSQPNKQKSHNNRLLTKYLVLILWFVALAAAYANVQNIKDWIKLRGYTAPPAIVSLADQDSMTGYGRKILYVNHPQILAKDSFTNFCPSSTAEQTIVLGCYHSGQSGIYLLNVSDARLNGVEQVTAAHEMLHGAYERLSNKDRQNIDAMLLNYYHNGLTDERIIKTIDDYRRTEPNDVVNEMHSVFGTEVQNLPAPLENYYKRYFNNRQQIAAFAARYQSEFTSRQAAVATYDKQLLSMKQQIDNLESDLKSKQQAINDQQQYLTNLKTSNVNAYNAAVPSFNAAIEAYNSEVQQVRSLINTYNQTVTTRNAIAFEENQLVKDLSAPAAAINN